jgi:CubicO group peptidase (beta-lactamase class C family)
MKADLPALFGRVAFLLALTAGLAGCAAVPNIPQGRPARVAVAFDRNAVRGSWSDGLADLRSGRLAAPDDPVRIASISKLVVAVGTMRLAEQGKLDLDRDVNDYLGWSLRNPAYPDRPISLRMLLSHTSSLRDGDDAYVVPLGRMIRDAVSDPDVWDAAHAPGAGYFAYANFNFPLVASIMEKVTGERFDRWMRREVIVPLQIDACFNWPTCSDAAIDRAVVLTQGGRPVRDDLDGGRPDCAVVVSADGKCDLGRWRAGDNGALFSPQGGLRISVLALARIGKMLLNGGMIDGVRILTSQSINAMLTPQWRRQGSNGARSGEGSGMCAYGLGIQLPASGIAGCADNPGLPAGDWSGHSGEAYGLRSGLWIDRTAGLGIAYFVTGLPDDPPPGSSDFSAPEEEMIARSLALLSAGQSASSSPPVRHSE